MRHREDWIVGIGSVLILAFFSLLIWAFMELQEPAGMEYRWKPVAGQHCVEARQGGYYCEDPND